jgi:MoxR-like ATPase
MLEAMNEAKATIDGTSYDIPKPFMVIATQNPFEYKGTFPLPENQLDRFALRISIGYPDRESEKRILSATKPANSWDSIRPVISKEEVMVLQKMSERVRVDESILDYILGIISETRNPKMFELGVSPRGAMALKNTAQSRALIDGRNYCIPEDVKEMAVPVLAHRVVLRNERFMGQGGEEEALREVPGNVRVPV